MSILCDIIQIKIQLNFSMRIWKQYRDKATSDMFAGSNVNQLILNYKSSI
uniref:Uncharacterized protein n=1 Tax=Rhizophora mucronata TaxID=61149 RepID=A0A2P2PCI8_RHIMU